MPDLIGAAACIQTCCQLGQTPRTNTPAQWTSLHLGCVCWSSPPSRSWIPTMRPSGQSSWTLCRMMRPATLSTGTLSHGPWHTSVWVIHAECRCLPFLCCAPFVVHHDCRPLVPQGSTRRCDMCTWQASCGLLAVTGHHVRQGLGRARSWGCL